VKPDPVQKSDGVLHHSGPTSRSGPFRCGYVAIVGLPNVGKSTLLNTLLGQKISIVSPKPQTTRHKLLGICSTESFQIIFLDTPGLLKPKYALQEIMMECTDSAAAEADVILFMIDAVDPPDPGQQKGVEYLRGLKAVPWLVINKVDLVFKPTLLPLIEAYARTELFREIFPISALKGIGTDDLLRALAREIPEHPPLYPLDIASEHSERFLVAEIIREKLFLHCHEEIPYSATVDVTAFQEKEEGKTVISAEIYVEKDSQKGIVIGRGGSMLKRIGASARKEIEDLIQKQVFLDLHVKVIDDWRKNRKWLGRLGYKT
jgi:GTP-binding protein Era